MKNQAPGPYKIALYTGGCTTLLAICDVNGTPIAVEFDSSGNNRKTFDLLCKAWEMGELLNDLLIYSDQEEPLEGTFFIPSPFRERIEKILE